jgi:hypothetical protein
MKNFTIILLFVSNLVMSQDLIVPHYEVDKDSQGNVYYSRSDTGGTYLPFFSNIASREIVNKLKYTGVTHHPDDNYRVSIFRSAGLEEYYFLVNTQKTGGIRDRLYKIAATYTSEIQGDNLVIEYVLQVAPRTDIEFGYYPNLPEVVIFSVNYELYELGAISKTGIKFFK